MKLVLTSSCSLFCLSLSAIVFFFNIFILCLYTICYSFHYFGLSKLEIQLESVKCVFNNFVYCPLIKTYAKNMENSILMPAFFQSCVLWLERDHLCLGIYAVTVIGMLQLGQGMIMTMGSLASLHWMSLSN